MTEPLNAGEASALASGLVPLTTDERIRLHAALVAIASGAHIVMPASDVQEGRSVRIPASADEAELMEKLGFQYLAEHAPERLTDDGQIRAAAQSPPSRQAEPEMVECEWSEDNQDGCPYCSGEACAQCVPHGDPPCEHDSFERHQRRPAAAPDTEQAQTQNDSSERGALPPSSPDVEGEAS